MNSSQKNVLPTEVDVLIETETINVPMPSPKVSFIESIGWKRCVLIGLAAVFFIALGYDTIYRVAWNDIKRTDYIIPLVIAAAYFVWRRQWNFVGAFVLGMAIGGLIFPATVFGWQKNLDYWQQWGGLVAGPALSANDAHQDNMLHGQLLDAKKPRNQSLESLLLSVSTPPKQAKLILAVLAVGMLAAMVWLARGADSRTQLVLVSAFVSWNLLIPPISESHYFGLMILPNGLQNHSLVIKNPFAFHSRMPL
jgi:hypothetical protein